LPRNHNVRDQHDISCKRCQSTGKWSVSYSKLISIGVISSFSSRKKKELTLEHRIHTQKIHANRRDNHGQCEREKFYYCFPMPCEIKISPLIPQACRS
jgi:hypothetical protein